jgi:hypothetical protein
MDGPIMLKSTITPGGHRRPGGVDCSVPRCLP